ncbi:MAG TPA: hypothetical protein VEJ84_22910, partial [Acidimicrobiales bacterium]|nr:hypothetical protein [Acidimicrobiales bacterium]
MATKVNDRASTAFEQEIASSSTGYPFHLGGDGLWYQLGRALDYYPAKGAEDKQDNPLNGVQVTLTIYETSYCDPSAGECGPGYSVLDKGSHAKLELVMAVAETQEGYNYGTRMSGPVEIPYN